ncbi:MAG: vWA domain-containing protein [Christensenellaceae bacterium]
MKELSASLPFSCLLMMLTVFSAFSAVSAEGEAAGGTQPVWPAQGSIKLDKDAAAVEGAENLWEITLGIQGKNFETTSDVVLVIDCSGSMEGDKLTNTRKAAKAFGQKLLTEGSTTRIAIVTFIDEATAYNNGHFYGAGELAAFETAVDGATYANGGTNQQAGLHVAQQLLNTSTAGLKNIVILSDGEATFSHPFVAAATYSDCGAWTSLGCPRGGSITNIGAFAPDYTTVIGSGSSFTLDYNARVTATCPEHGGTTTQKYVYNLDGTATTKSGTDNGVATIWEANQAKAAGTTIYSVALQAGTNGENTLKACATDATKDYYAIASTDNVEETLTTAFTSIAGSIAIAARNGVVNDPMGEHVQLNFSGSAPVITTDKAVYDAGNADIYISQGTATYDAATRAISWTVGNVSEGDNPIMKYKVGIRDGYNPSTNEVLNTNGRTTFSYKNYLGDDTVGDFPIPKVHVGGGMILVHWYQVNSKGEPINELGQTVEGPAYAKEVKPAEYFADNGSTGLSYNTPYTVAKSDFANYTYYGSYNLNNGSLTVGDAATVTLTAANSNQHVWFAYTQSFRVGHVQFAANETDTTVYYTEHTVEQFNLTSVVTNGFLYGGAFSDAACETVQSFAEGQNSTAFAPEAGATYYIWEADAQFLSPRNLSCWNHVSENTVDVTGFYLVTPVDRLNYREVGFMVGSETLPAKQFTETEYNGVRCGDHSGSYRQPVLCLRHRKSRFQQRHKRYVQCFKRYHQQDPRIPCLLRHG